MASPQRTSQRNRSTRAFSQIEDPAMLRQLDHPMTPPIRLSSPVAAPGKTVEIRRLVSPSRSPQRSVGDAARTPPSTPPSTPPPSRLVASGKPPMPSKLASPNSSAGTSTTTAASSLQLPPQSERAHTRENPVAGLPPPPPQPIRDTSEWRETANRLSQRVKELELENFRLKASGSSGNLRKLSRSFVAAPPKTFAGGEMSALLSATKAAEAEDALEYHNGSSGPASTTTAAATKRGTILKSKSYAAELGHTGSGFTVAEAALASHRSRSKRTASTAAAPPQLSAAGANPLVDKLRAGYWNGNNVKSSFSCNNLADMDRRDIAVEKLNLLLQPPAPAPAPPQVLPPAPIPKKKLPSAAPPLLEKANSTNTRGVTRGNRDAAALMKSFSRGKDSFLRAGSGSSSNIVLDNDFGATHQQQLAIATSFHAPEAMLRRSSSSFQSIVDTVVDDDDTSVSELSEAYTPSSQHRITSPRSLREADFLTNGSLASSRGKTAATKPKTLMKRPNSTDVRMWVGTWNMGAADPFADGNGILDEQRSGAMLQHLLPHGCQLYVLGVQEGVNENVYHAVEAYLNRNERGTRYYRLELRNSNCLLVNKNHPIDAVIDAVHGRGDGAFMGTKFTGLAVFVSADVQDKVKLMRVGVHKFNITSGSKGGVAVALLINNTTMVFVNCHLDARNDTYRREQVRNLNANLGKIMGHYSFDLTEQFHHVVWMGDMNYRIVHLDPQMVLHMLAEGRNLELHDKFDGLLNDRRTSGIFEGFTEPNKFPDFYPTYKKLPKRGFVNESLPSWPTLVYRVLYKEPFYKGGKVKKRVPGWCDRILVHSLLVSDSKLMPEKVESPFDDQPTWIDNYRSVNHGNGMDVSDHSPVFATFVLSFPCLGKDKSGAKLSPHRMSRRSNRSHSTFSDGRSTPEFRQQSVTESYFDQPKVVRHINSVRPVSTVLIVSNMQLYWNDKALVPKKTRVVAPLVGEDLKQCDVIGERCQEAFALSLSLNALIQHSRPLEQLHMLVWVKNDSIVGHCTLSLKRIARQEEGGEVRFRVPLYNNSMRLYHEGHPLLVVFSVRAKTFAK
uniref:Inositol polyphosphate-related phosphatase domain-containing protein n=1 Tax=Globisporangium ultimum (strain ATCC 200006 / CBS 805.95 / DAOM BR144) TaxID=431595 RepID=K3WZF9_GLOUD